MNFPIHDRFGEINQAERAKHLSTSVTIDDFINHSTNKTLDELRLEGGADDIVLFEGIDSDNGTEILPPIGFETGLGPTGNNRYVQDPTDPGGVIDMRHFLEAARVGFFGEILGAGVEAQQGLLESERPGGFPSAWEREDYKSNFYGVVFRNNYFDPDREISDQFQEFLPILKTVN